MTRAADRWFGLPGWLLATGVIVFFVVVQAATLDYGTRINDIPFIRDYRVTTDVVSKSGLGREQLIGGKTDRAESLDLWMVRFKLYTVEADEVYNIIALARVRPAEFQFDPHYYQYGGAFLYPLGAWYLTLSKLGLIHVAPLEQSLAQSQQMDLIWIAGRAFVLAAFAASAFLLFLALIEIASTPVASAGLAIYLFCPASIMFSQVMKPHWYALLWVNAAVLIIVRAYIRNRLALASELLLAAAIGLAVGSTPTFALMAILLWGALAVLGVRGALSAMTLLRIPLVAVAIFALSNPYYILNWPAVQAERAAAATWFRPSVDLDAVVMFTQNSLFAGFGVALTLLIFAVSVWHLIRGPDWARLFAIAVIASIVIAAVATAGQATWNVNYRYIPYLLPAALVFIALSRWRYRGPVLALCAITTIAQAAPLKLAYFDENNAAHSTRLLAAGWIDANIPSDESICVSTNTLVPFDVPPFRFDLHKINSSDCRWMVRVERNIRAVVTDSRYQIEKRFTPRFLLQSFPLVWEHINPQITIYRKVS